MATRNYRSLKAHESYRRPVLAILHRNGTIVWTRHYRRLQNGIRRAVELTLEMGQPKDVVEFALSTGGQLGTIRVRAGGRMDLAWTELGKAEKMVEAAIEELDRDT